VADRPGQLILGALTRAAADGGGVPLHGGRSAPGLFPATAVGRQAARRCCDEGLLQTGDGPPGKGPVGTITDKGLAYLLQQRSPREVLEDFVRALEAREGQVAQLVAQARHLHASLEALRGPVAAALSEVSRPDGGLKALYRDFRADGAAAAVLAALARWAPVPHRDCPLPELFRQAQRDGAALTLGAFHDALRALREAGQVHLHPWTGPLYDMPEPACALLVGHEVAYYASVRRNGESPGHGG
jgi:hypothetical protein